MFRQTTLRSIVVVFSVMAYLPASLPGGDATARAATPPDAEKSTPYRHDRDEPSRSKLSRQRQSRLETLLARGRKLERESSYDEALARYRSAYELFPHSAVLLSLARVHWKLDHDERAERAYEAFLARRPDYQERTRIESRLQTIRSRDSTADEPSESSASSPPGGTSRTSNGHESEPNTRAPSASGDDDAGRSETEDWTPTPASEATSSTSTTPSPPSRSETRGRVRSTWGVLGWMGVGVLTSGAGLLAGAAVAERTRQKRLDRLERAGRIGAKQQFHTLRTRTTRARRLRQGLTYGGAGVSLVGVSLIVLDVVGTESNHESAAPVAGLQVGTHDRSTIWLGWRGRF
jgi:hypothetical protein